jgi:CUB/sushi domain-containing protein
VFKNGAKAASGINFKTRHIIQAGGTYVLGQDQDHVGGGFSTSESMMGYLSQVNVGDKVIAKEKIQEVSSSCKYKMEGNVVSWSEFKTGARGDAKILVPSNCFQNL